MRFKTNSIPGDWYLGVGGGVGNRVKLPPPPTGGRGGGVEKWGQLFIISRIKINMKQNNVWLATNLLLAVPNVAV